MSRGRKRTLLIVGVLVLILLANRSPRAAR